MRLLERIRRQLRAQALRREKRRLRDLVALRRDFPRYEELIERQLIRCSKNIAHLERGLGA